MNRLFLTALIIAPLAACGNPQGKIDPSQQMGPNPLIPKPAQGLIADVGVPTVVGWKAGETPTVRKGFHIEAMATGLANPRTILPLPNGDVLVVEGQRTGSEPGDRPKDPIRDFIMSIGHGGGGGDKGPPPQRITLLRDANGDGKVE